MKPIRRLVALALAVAFVQPSLASAASFATPERGVAEHAMPHGDQASHDCCAPAEHSDRGDTSSCRHEGAADCAMMPGCLVLADVSLSAPTFGNRVATDVPAAPVDEPVAASRTPETPPPRG